MMVEMWIRTRKMVDEDETDLEDASGYEKSMVRLAWVGWEDHESGLFIAGSRLVPAILGMVNQLAHKILLSPSFSWWFLPSPLISPFLILNSNVIYGVTARHLATDHAKSTQASGAGMLNYPAHKLSFHSLPTTTQPWAEWSAVMQLTERMTFPKPNMHTVQVLNHLSALLHQHMVYHMEPCETNLEEHSQGVQHMRRSSCLL